MIFIDNELKINLCLFNTFLTFYGRNIAVCFKITIMKNILAGAIAIVAVQFSFAQTVKTLEHSVL